MLLIRLLYFSRSRLREWYASDACGAADIIAVSRRNNLRDGITGVLLHDPPWFVQVIEGPETGVSTAFERILHDQRHRDVALVTMQALPQRRHAGSTMTCIMRAADNDDLFRHYCEGTTFDPRQMRPDRLSDLVEAAALRHAMPATAGAAAKRVDTIWR